MAELFMIRHGETEFNKRNIVQGGGIDADLNDTGQMQGKAFFDFHQSIGFDAIYCTELKRTWQTIRHFETLGHEIRVVPELNEFGWGALEGVENNEEVRATFSQIWTRWRQGDLDARVPGGESPKEAWQRSKPGIERILAENKPDAKILVCSHGRIMRVFLSEMLGYGLSNMDLFPHSNTALNHLRSTGSDRFRVLRLNDLSHLS